MRVADGLRETMDDGRDRMPSHHPGIHREEPTDMRSSFTVIETATSDPDISWRAADSVALESAVDARAGGLEAVIALQIPGDSLAWTRPGLLDIYGPRVEPRKRLTRNSESF